VVVPFHAVSVVGLGVDVQLYPELGAGPDVDQLTIRFPVGACGSWSVDPRW
jgi:hypothetical protein